MNRLKTLLLTLSIGTKLFSQTALENLRNIIPPSPDASSIAKYGSWPVGLYTGVPNINIPIYELKGKGIGVPISLNYHAAGNSIGEVASWVGLGWSLQAGGLITRSVKGLPDDVGYFSLIANYTDPNNLFNYQDAAQRNIDQVGAAKSDLDTQEDIYSFTALGRTYKLLIKGDGSVETMPFSNIKIVSNPMKGNATAKNEQSWTVLLEDGTKLVFGGTGNFTEQTTDATFQRGDGTGIQYISSWYINSITSPEGEVMQFAYTQNDVLQDAYFSQNDNIEYLTNSNIPGFCTTFSHQGLVSTTQLLEVSGLVLASIESDLGKVEFYTDTDERLDVAGGHRLKEIKVKSKLSGTYIEDYLLNSSYSTATAGNALLTGTNTSYFGYRLHLDNLQLKNPANPSATVQQWSFDYNPMSLPSRRSYAQDHWGFFNGATSNNSLLPPINILSEIPPTYTNPPVFTPPYHDPGADRSPHPDYMQAEMLTAIHYPTGGSSKFVYEPNSYPSNEEAFATTPLSLDLNMYGANNYSDKSTTFTVTKPQYITLTLGVLMTANLLADQPSASISVTIKSGATVFGSLVATNTVETQYVYLPPGTYTYTLSPQNVDVVDLPAGQQYVQASTNFTYQQSQGMQMVNHYVGGLRIQSIVDNDGIGTTDINPRYFKYEDPLVINPVDENTDYYNTMTRSTIEFFTNSADFAYCYFKKIIRNSSTKFSLGSIEGGTVGYAKVTTSFGPNNENGRTERYFMSIADQGLGAALVFPYPASDSRDWRRGLLEKEMVYDAGNNLLKKTENTYTFTPKGSMVGFKSGYTDNPYDCSTGAGTCGINTQPCPTSNEQVKRLSSTETVKDPANGNLLATTATYSYDDPLNTQPTQMVTENSKEESIKTLYKYPFDFSTTAPYGDMVVRNIVSPVVEQVQTNTTLANKELGKTRTNFNSWRNGSFIEPAALQNSYNGNIYETEATVDSYDAKGNVLQVTGKDGIVTSYFYGYGSRYPVAKITGSDHATISQYITQSDLDNPTDDGAVRNIFSSLRYTLSGAMITSYTYRPLIGISSQTDPAGRTTYYEYDAMNRLYLVRDQDNYILKRYCYSYKGQIGACPASQPPQVVLGGTCTDYFYPPPPGNLPFNSDATYKCVNNVGESQLGHEHYTSSIYNPSTGIYTCTYHYEFSDGIHSWDLTKTSTGSCMPANSCSTGNCPGPGNSCIDGTCEKGLKVYDHSLRSLVNGNWQWYCSYHYEFSDGSQSDDLLEASTTGTCAIDGTELPCSRLSCSGIDRKCIDGICEIGVEVGLGSNNNTYFYCYEWSDGSVSNTYSRPFNNNQN